MNPVSALLTANSSHKDWIPLIEVAAKDVFELMVGCQLTGPTSAEVIPPDITAMVGLTGGLCGVLSVCCDEKTAVLMTSKMLGVPLDKIGPEVSDALGEVCNMVAGNFKNKIPGLGDGCQLSPPTVITGSEYDLHFPAGSLGLDVRLLFEGMPIAISLQIHS